VCGKLDTLKLFFAVQYVSVGYNAVDGHGLSSFV